MVNIRWMDVIQVFREHLPPQFIKKIEARLGGSHLGTPSCPDPAQAIQNELRALLQGTSDLSLSSTVVSTALGKPPHPPPLFFGPKYRYVHPGERFYGEKPHEQPLEIIKNQASSPSGEVQAITIIREPEKWHYTPEPGSSRAAARAALTHNQRVDTLFEFLAFPIYTLRYNINSWLDSWVPQQKRYGVATWSRESGKSVATLPQACSDTFILKPNMTVNLQGVVGGEGVVLLGKTRFGRTIMTAFNSGHAYGEGYSRYGAPEDFKVELDRLRKKLDPKGPLRLVFVVPDQDPDGYQSFVYYMEKILHGLTHGEKSPQTERLVLSYPSTRISGHCYKWYDFVMTVPRHPAGPIAYTLLDHSGTF